MPLVKRTRATLRSAELGFFGVVVYTRVQTPRFCGQFFRAGAVDFVVRTSLPLRISWLIVGISGTSFLSIGFSIYKNSGFPKSLSGFQYRRRGRAGMNAASFSQGLHRFARNDFHTLFPAFPANRIRNPGIRVVGQEYGRSLFPLQGLAGLLDSDNPLGRCRQCFQIHVFHSLKWAYLSRDTGIL
jgi:hypothetical protein